MAVELASRALGAAPEVTADGATMKLAGYRIPSAVPNTLTLNFEGGADAIPTHSFADLYLCAGKGDTEFFRRNFAFKRVPASPRRAGCRGGIQSRAALVEVLAAAFLVTGAASLGTSTR